MRLVQSKNQRSETPLVRDTDKHSSSSSSSILENLLLKQRMNPDDVSSILMDMIILGVQAVRFFSHDIFFTCGSFYK